MRCGEIWASNRRQTDGKKEDGKKRRDSVFVITGNKGLSFLAGIYESTRYRVHRTIMDLECVTHG